MSSPPAGGPSTINGVLYQMLWCLFRAARLHISSLSLDVTGQEITQATLRLEPSGGGGDLQEITVNHKVVAQLKARSNGGTWSLRDVIEQVIPDLYLAIDPGVPETEYQFITEGRMGAWLQVYAFFQSLSTRSIPPGDALAALDNAKAIPFRGVRRREDPPTGDEEPFWSDGPYTERTLFERVVEEVRKRPTIARREEPLETTQRNVWHLLANFTFVGGQTQGHLRQQVDSLLLALVNFDTEVSEKRDAMLTRLARHAAQGSADVDSTKFLAEYRLDAVPLTNWLMLRERGQKHLEGELRRRGYKPDDDVRKDFAANAMAQWPSSSPMLVLSGESGQGKSWLLFALANRLATEKELTILVDATGDAQRDIDHVAGLFWREIKRNDTGPGLDRIAARRRELIHGRAERWLTVFIDGVQDPSEVKALAIAPWEDWNVRLVVTCQSDLARMFERQGRDRAVVFEVGDFTVPQLQLYLEDRFGDEWSNIPADLRDTIRRPLLAQLYSAVAADRSWRPTNEYELVSAYWNRLRQNEQALNPLDVVGLQRLARGLLDRAPYPWGPEQLAKADLENATVARLVRLGFLRQTEAGQFELWHDRILNWAVAQGLVAALRTNEMGAEAFCKQLQSLFTGDQTYSGRFLGYVPMDAVWAIADPETGLPSLIDQVVQALEAAGWQHAEVLYDHLLPTVGPRIVPTLYRRFAAVSASGDVVLENRIVGAITTFAEPYTADRTADLLKTGAPSAKRAALTILAKRPNPKLLDTIWQLRCQTQANAAGFLREGDWKELLNEECYHALKAAVRLDRLWLERAIVQADPKQEPVHDLAYLLASLDDAADLWRAHKSALFAKVQPPNHRSLALNIYVYRDADEVDWLIRQIGRSEDLIGAWAFRALIRINPDLAVEHLGELPEQGLYLMASTSRSGRSRAPCRT